MAIPTAIPDDPERESGWKDAWFLQRLIVVGHEIDGILADVLKHLFAELAEFCFGIPHCSRWIAIDRSEVSLGLHNRIAQGEVLSETDKCIINRCIPVRMVFTEYVADYTRALAGRG